MLISISKRCRRKNNWPSVAVVWNDNLPRMPAVTKILGSFSNDDGDGNENVKKAIGLWTKTRGLHVPHAFWYFSLPSLHDYDVKMPNFTFYGGRVRRRIFLSLPKLECRRSPRTSTPQKFANIWHFRRIGINATKFGKTPIRFKSDVITFSLPSPSSILWPYETRELKQWRRRLRKRHLNGEVALLQTLSRLSHLVHQILASWILKGCIKVREKKEEVVVLCSSRLPQNVKLHDPTSFEL